MAFSLNGWNIGHADDIESGPWGVDELALVDLTNATVGRRRLTESRFCCAEPTELQLQRSGATGVSFQSRC
jgi:hypothetical protein